ncbi:hypothetical protein GGR21_002995 [Dysgonomonas hofstadii]|uniref:Replication-associated protein ORF2/G2P domain-containing protein n=1 Tax=Dysgonomonas hofstadii TaxID=637886 RepID=A0A840CM59_9BACT|nr:hypothetical protein [Dysgonomonas hofstadii]MBB4037080.1 hypothetical protein [Dysgonomonas hofstadii]
MGIILKENNLIYTKMKHDKFLGSSTYKYNKATNTIYKKVKLKANIPQSDIQELNQNKDYVTDNEFRESINDFYNDGHQFSRFKNKDEQLHHEKPKRPKKTIYTLNKKKVREKCSAFFGLRKSKKFLAFYSISFPQNFPDEFAYKCFNTVLTRLRKKCGLKSYLWVAERQKNGTIHFHMLTNTFMQIRIVNYFMARAINNQIRKKENKGKINVNFDIQKYNGVDVRHVNNNRKALNCYLTKYVSKNTISFYKLPYHSSHDISELFTAETFVNENTNDFKPIKETLKHIKTFVVDNEWCTIEYLCQKQDNGKYFNPPDSWYWLRDFLNEQIYKNHYAKVKFDNMPLS